MIRRAFRASVPTMGGTVANSPDRGRSPQPRCQCVRGMQVGTLGKSEENSAMQNNI